MQVSGLFIYPIKSLQGVSLNEMHTTDRGPKNDRRWMLVDSDGMFVTQREHTALVHFGLEMNGKSMLLSHPGATDIEVPLSISSGVETNVQVWNSKVKALVGPDEWNKWFSEILGSEFRLVYMPEYSERTVNWSYARRKALTTFTDGYPYLVIGQSSLDDLNSRLEDPILMDRFRPNIVFTGGEPFAEDSWKEVQIGSAVFKRVKPCSRCVVTTTDQQTGERGKEPLRTLNTYRKQGDHVNFGQNLLCLKQGVLSIGDTINAA